RGDTAARLGHAFERADDAHDGAEQSDERSGGADGGENTEVLLELRDRDHGRAVHALARGFDGQLRIGGALIAARSLELEQPRGDDLGEMAGLVLLGDLDGLAVIALGEQIRERAEETERLIL